MHEITGMSAEEIKQVNEGPLESGRVSDNVLISKFSSISTTINQTMDAIHEGTKTVEEGLKEIDKNLRSLKQ